jgi:hypothetical protein
VISDFSMIFTYKGRGPREKGLVMKLKHSLCLGLDKIIKKFAAWMSTLVKEMYGGHKDIQSG